MDAGRMKPAGARQFEAARPLPCREASDTKVFAKALLAANHARDGKLSDVSFADATWVMLLDLFVSQAHDGRLSLSDLYTSKNGRESCRERVCQYVSISVVDGPFNTKPTEHNDHVIKETEQT